MKLFRLGCLVILLLAGRRVAATDYTFVNPAGGNWSVATNWAPTGVPGAGDNATILGRTNIVTLDVNVTLATLTVGSGADSPAFRTVARTLTLTGASTVAAGAAFLLAGGTLTGSAELTVSGVLTWTAGTMSGTGHTIIAGAGILNLSTTASKTLSRVLANEGTTTWTSGTLSMSNGTINNRGQFTANSSGTLLCGDSSGSSAFNNTGRFIKEGVGTTQFSIVNNHAPAVSFNNSGTVDVQAGTLGLDTGGTHVGNFTVSNAAVLRWAATHTLSAASDISGEGTLAVISGVTTNTGAIKVGSATISGGTAAFNGSFQARDLTLSGGTVTGSADLVVTGILNWTGGTMAGIGQTIVAASAALNLNTPAIKTLRRTLRNEGTASWTEGSFSMVNGTFNNSGQFTASTANSLVAYDGSGASTFNNSGVFIKRGFGLAKLSIVNKNEPGATFNNSGTVDVQAGTLELGTSGTHTGDFAVGAGTLLSFAKDHTLSVASDISGLGDICLKGGTMIDAGTVNIGGDAEFGLDANNLVGMATFTGSVQAGNLTVSGGKVDFNTGSGVVVGGGAISSGTVTGSANLTMTGIVNWMGGTMAGAGQTIIDAFGVLNINGTATKSLNRVLRNDGNVNWTEGTLGMVSGTFNNRGQFTTSTTGTIVCNDGSGNSTFNNTGKFTKLGKGTTQFSLANNHIPAVSFNNDGTVEVQVGTLGLDTGGTHGGNFTVSDGARLRWGATHTFSTASEIGGAGGVLIINGVTTNVGAINIGSVTIAAGTASFNGSFQAGTLTLNGGTISGSADMTISAILNWTDGTMTGTGQTIVAASATFNLSGPLTKDLNRTLRNDGTTIWTDGSFSMVNGTFNNGGQFTVDTTKPLVGYDASGSSTFNNTGTFIKTGVGLAEFSVANKNRPGAIFNNSGAVEVLAGMLELGTGGTHSGAFTVGTGALLSFAGDHTLSATSDISGGGGIRLGGGAMLDAGTVNLGGNANFGLDANNLVGTATFTGSFRAGSLTLSGGTVNFNTASGAAVGGGTVTTGTVAGSANLTTSGVFNWTGGTMAGAGQTIVDALGVLNFNGAATKNLNRVLRNDGSVNWTEGTLTLVNGTIINNGVFRANSALEVRCFGNGGVNTFNNFGTLIKQGVGTERIHGSGSGVSFNNSGTVDIQLGTLTLETGYSANPASRVRFLLSSLTPRSGYGLLRITGTANLASTLDVAFAPGYLPATGDVFEIVNYSAPGTDFTAVAGEADQFDQIKDPTRLQLRGRPGLAASRPPEITQQPAGRAAAPGDTVVLNVVATGSPAPSYQWRRNGQNLPGESEPQLVVIIAGPENGGSYACVVYNENGAILSNPADVTVFADPLPFSDNFFTRGEINSLTGVGVSTNTFATREVGEPLHAGKAGTTSVWIDYLSPATGTLEISTFGSNFDTLIAIYTGTAVASLTPVTADDDDAGFYTSRVRFGVTAGARYAVGVDGRAGVTGNLVFRWTLTPNVPPPPRVLVPPKDQLTRLGGTVVFTLTVADALSFQWLKDGVDLVDGGRVSGSSTSNLTITGVTRDDVANYRVELRGNGTLRSSLAALQVDPAVPDGPALPLVGTRDKFSDLLDERSAGFLPGGGRLVQLAGGAHPTGLSRGISGTLLFSTVGANTEPGEYVPCGYLGGASHWMDYAAELDGILTVDSADSNFDTVMAAYYNDCAICSAQDALEILIPLACNNDVSPIILTSRMSFAVTNGSIYSIVVDGVNGASGLVQLSYKAVPTQPTLATPVITTPVLTTEGRLQFRVNGGTGLMVRVDASADLINFAPVLTNTIPVGGLLFIDSWPVVNGRYFRAVML